MLRHVNGRGAGRMLSKTALFAAAAAMLVLSASSLAAEPPAGRYQLFQIQSGPNINGPNFLLLDSATGQCWQRTQGPSQYAGNARDEWRDLSAPPANRAIVDASPAAPTNTTPAISRAIAYTPVVAPTPTPSAVRAHHDGLRGGLLIPNGKAYFFHGNQYQRYDFTADKVDKVGRIGRDGWWGVWDDGFDAAVMHPNGKAYFFRGDQYQRYDFTSRPDGRDVGVDKTGQIGRDGWWGVWQVGIQAAILHPNGKAYFFRGDQYQRYDFTMDRVDKTARIGSDGWWGVWSDGFDAAVRHPNGKAYFFRDGQYMRYDFNTRADGRDVAVDKTGRIGVDGWWGLETAINGKSLTPPSQPVAAAAEPVKRDSSSGTAVLKILGAAIGVETAKEASPNAPKSVNGTLTIVAAPGEAPPDATGATHQQTKIIRPAEGESGWRLACFCLTKDGRIAAALSRPERPAIAAVFGFAEEKSADDAKDKTDATPVVAGELRLLDGDGKLLKKWTLDFEPQAISVAPDDTLCLAGDGVLSRFDLTGKQLARAESPQVVTARQDPKGLEARARATLEEQRNAYKQVITSLESQKESLKGKEDKDLTDSERLTKQNIDRQIEMYKQIDARQSKEITDAQVKATAASLAKQDRRVNAIAAGSKYIYTTTRANKGYGYRVWRSDLDFSNSKQIVDGLSGCCGQMDVQCCGDDVVVAENSRYRVVRYDPEGTKLAAFGKSDRDGGGEGFSGCCNPMNTRACGDKLYVSESNGLVKLFSKDGKYEGVVGVAKVQAGCKSSIVDVSPDGNRVYYIDVNNSAICVLERTAGDKTAAQ